MDDTTTQTTPNTMPNKDTKIADFIRARVRKELFDVLNVPDDTRNFTGLINDLVTKETVIKASTVAILTSLSLPAIYRKISMGEFPKPIKLGERASGWPLSEVIAWIEHKKRERDEGPNKQPALNDIG